MNAKTTDAPNLRVLIARFLSAGPSCLPEIAAAVGKTKTPAHVTAELNSMRTDALLECTVEQRKPMQYWLAVPLSQIDPGDPAQDEPAAPSIDLAQVIADIRDAIGDRGEVSTDQLAAHIRDMFTSAGEKIEQLQEELEARPADNAAPGFNSETATHFTYLVQQARVKVRGIDRAKSRAIALAQKTGKTVEVFGLHPVGRVSIGPKWTPEK
jgi:hypothetical protein